jgi:hypothetical protein
MSNGSDWWTTDGDGRIGDYFKNMADNNIRTGGEEGAGPSSLLGESRQDNSNHGGSDGGDSRYWTEDFETNRYMVHKHGGVLEDAVSELDRTFGLNSSRFYVSDLFVLDDEEQTERYASYMARKSRNHAGGFVLVSSHPSKRHIHVMHDCAYSDRSCRCSWLRTEKTKAGERFRKRLRRVIPIHKLGPRDWRNILIYFSTQGRFQRGLIIRGRISTFKMPDSTLGREEDHVDGPGGLVEGDGSRCGDQLFQEIEDRQPDTTGHRGKLKARETRSVKGGGLYQEIEKLLSERPCCPINGIVDTLEWLEHPRLKYMRLDDPVVKNALDVWKKLICRYTMADLQQLYRNPLCIPSFTTGYVPVNQKYMSIEDSVAALIKLLEFQMGESVVEFLTTLYEIIERKKPKMNAFLIKSPPQGGKNFFMDVFLNFMLNRGQLSARANKTNCFAFQEAYGKRILLWNEPNYEAAETDTLKMIFGGDDYTVRVKCKEDTSVYKTPIIILTNNTLPFMFNSAFEERVAMYEWSVAPLLKDYNLKPTPLAAWHLLEHYNIVQPLPIVE